MIRTSKLSPIRLSDHPGDVAHAFSAPYRAVEPDIPESRVNVSPGQPTKLLAIVLAFAWLLPLGAQDWENPVRKLLEAGKPVVGVTINVNSVDVAAHAANMGFDFLWMEMEHSPLTLETLRDMVLATRGLKAIPFARVPVNELWTAKRVLDAGVLGVIFPFTGSPAMARQAVAACKYPPQGLRGSGAGLASFRWPSPEGYHKFANRNVMVVTLIENQAGVDHVDEIARIPGIDVIFIGPSDLSWQLGIGGQYEHPRFKAAVAKIIAAANRNNKVLGRPASSAEQVSQYREQGFTFFQSGSVLGLMREGARKILEPLGKKGFDPAEKLLY